jgi:hypothetical protein
MMDKIKREIERLENALLLLQRCENRTAEDEDESYYMQERLNSLRLKLKEANHYDNP